MTQNFATSPVAEWLQMEHGVLLHEMATLPGHYQSCLRLLEQTKHWQVWGEGKMEWEGAKLGGEGEEHSGEAADGLDPAAIEHSRAYPLQ